MLVISTYSSGSCRETTPSKKMQRMTTSAPEEVDAGVAVGVAGSPLCSSFCGEPRGARQPASIASSSVQNRRSPADSSMTVRE